MVKVTNPQILITVHRGKKALKIQGSGTTYIRGSNTIFTQDAGAPAWEEYTIPVWKDWRYVQLKLLG